MANRTSALRETVIRHRGGGRDENGQLMPDTSVPIESICVAPGGGSEQVGRARDGEVIEHTVYFPAGTDVVNADELTVRGQRFHIIVNDWRADPDELGGVEVLCTRGQG